MTQAAFPARLVAVVGLGMAVWLAVGDPVGLGPSAKAAGLVAGAIALYATGVVSEYVTAILFFAIAMLFSVAAPDVVFSGFASNAFWLVFAGLIIGVSVNITGLGARVARTLSGLFPASYLGLLIGFTTIALILAFFMPSSMGRIVLLMPIVLAVADRYRLAEGGRGRIGLALVTGFACFNPSNGILPATVPNMVYAGAVEAATGRAPLYGEWMLLHFPLLGLGKAALLVVCGWLLFREPVRWVERSDGPGPLSGAEMRLALILIGALMGWASDVVHGLSPAWIGLAAAAICLLPGFGVVSKDGFKKIDFTPAVYVAGILGLGALISHSGFGAWLGVLLADALPLVDGAAVRNVLLLTIGGGAMALASTMPALPAVMVPLSDSLAAASGLPEDTVLATVVLSYSTTILPYQAPPLILALGLAGARLVDATKLVVAVAAGTLVAILPLTLLWWNMLGLL